MAVVFISPKKRQRTFFVAITLGLLAFLGFISLGVMSSTPPEIDTAIVYNKAKINIDMSVFDSDRFKNLKSSTEMGVQYAYKVVTKSKLTEEGFISSSSETLARKKLEDNGLTVISLKETGAGRDNPFVPYYVVAPKVTQTSADVASTTPSTENPPAGQSGSSTPPII